MERITVDQQDAINAVSTAYRWRSVEQFEFKMFILACEAQGGITAERVQPFIDGLNAATKRLWSAWWNCFNLGLCKRPNPGTAPIVKWNKNLRCDGRCQNATGFDCECSCIGSNHGILAHLGLQKVKDPAAIIKMKKRQAKEEMKSINENTKLNLDIQATKYIHSSR